MSKVEFDEFQAPSSFEFDDTPKMVKWVIKYSGGLIKNEKQANYFLLGFVALILIVSGFLLFGSNKTIKNINPEQYGDQRVFSQ